MRFGHIIDPQARAALQEATDWNATSAQQEWDALQERADIDRLVREAAVELSGEAVSARAGAGARGSSLAPVVSLSARRARRAGGADAAAGGGGAAA